MTEDAAPREYVQVAFPAGDPPMPGVALVTFARREALNALSYALIAELDAKLAALDADPGCRAIVITGAGSRAFAVGADVKELSVETPQSLHDADPFAAVDRVALLATPTIAAVRGFALGGGCELAMACDMLVAGDDAQFGQPEILIGVIPGAGGTQRLARAVGRAKAMELVLTGRRLDAVEAERLGLVTTVVPAAETVTAALDLAAKVASMPPLAVRAAKAAVNAAQQLPLVDGLRYERDRFEALFATADQREGMAAFLDKRTADWSGR
jgi:enoyl-CoA hydratase